jgi:hypothetical protein
MAEPLRHVMLAGFVTVTSTLAKSNRFVIEKTNNSY